MKSENRFGIQDRQTTPVLGVTVRLPAQAARGLALRPAPTHIQAAIFGLALTSNRAKSTTAQPRQNHGKTTAEMGCRGAVVGLPKGINHGTRRSLALEARQDHGGAAWLNLSGLGRADAC